MTGYRKQARTYPRPKAARAIPVVADIATTHSVPVAVLNMNSIQAADLLWVIHDIAVSSLGEGHKREAIIDALQTIPEARQHYGAQSREWTAAWKRFNRQKKTDGVIVFMRAGLVQPTLFALGEVA